MHWAKKAADSVFLIRANIWTLCWTPIVIAFGVINWCNWHRHWNTYFANLICIFCIWHATCLSQKGYWFNLQVIRANGNKDNMSYAICTSLVHICYLQWCVYFNCKCLEPKRLRIQVHDPRKYLDSVLTITCYELYRATCERLTTTAPWSWISPALRADAPNTCGDTFILSYNLRGTHPWPRKLWLIYFLSTGAEHRPGMVN